MDECLVKPCPVHATCANTPGFFHCSCAAGFEGGADARNCTDVNECLTGAFTCDPHAVCRNKLGGYDCVCKPGFVALPDGSCLGNVNVLLKEGFGS